MKKTTPFFKKEWIKTFGKIKGFIVFTFGKKINSSSLGNIYLFRGKLYFFQHRVYFGENQNV